MAKAQGSQAGCQRARKAKEAAGKGAGGQAGAQAGARPSTGSLRVSQPWHPAGAAWPCPAPLGVLGHSPGLWDTPEQGTGLRNTHWGLSSKEKLGEWVWKAPNAEWGNG